MRRIIAALIFVLLLAGCSKPTASEDTSQRIRLAVEATLTAQPSLTPIPTATMVAKQALPTTVPTSVPTATTSIATTVAPTATAASSATAAPAASPSSAPTATPTTVPTSTVATGPEVRANRTANLRAGPGTNYAIVGSAKEGQTYAVQGRTTDGSWFEVCCVGGKSAWVAAAVVDTSGGMGSVQVAKNVPTPPPTSTPGVVAQVPSKGKRDMEVTFINPHYECEQREWTYRGDMRGMPGVQITLWGYRQFQIDMFIKNNTDAPIPTPWHPTRWIITNGRDDSVLDLWWTWGSAQGQWIQQGPIPPGQTAGWTFMAFPLDRDQWVKAVEYIRNGQVYRYTPDLGPLRNNFNFKDCGDPGGHTVRPTPTPWPLP